RLFAPLFATKRKRPDVSIASATGFVPTENAGDVALSAPVDLLIVNAATLPESRLATYAKRLHGSMAIANGPVPRDVRLPTSCSAPLDAPIEKMEMSFDA